MIAVVSNGFAVLELGNIGARASFPVIEGKCVLFRNFGIVAAFSMCMDSQDNDIITAVVKLLEALFPGVNLGDIDAPCCFGIEERLEAETGMISLHDDRYGTSIVTLACLFNALKFYSKELKGVSIVINEAAGFSIVQLLNYLYAANIVVCDLRGIISSTRTL